MPTETLLTQMEQRRGTASEWATANPILKDGEIGIIKGTKTFKVGDGVTAFNSLMTWYAEVSQAYVDGKVADLVNSAPSLLDTIGELAAALASDESAAAALATLVATKAPLADPAFTGNPTAPTQSVGNNSTRLATTAFVAAAIAALGTGVQVTVDFGLPTTAGRNSGDLHYDRISGRLFSLVNGAWASAAGAVNSYGAGLPPSLGRYAGDHAFDTITWKDYVLGGVAGTTATDLFSGTADLNGATTPVGSKVWGVTSGSGTVFKNNGQVSTQGYIATIDLGATGDASVQARFLCGNGAYRGQLLLNATSSGGGNSIVFGFDRNTNTYSLTAGAQTLASGAALGSGGGVLNDGEHLITLGITGDTITVTVDGTVLISGQRTGAASTTTLAGFSTSSLSYAKNFTAQAAGSLKWVSDTDRIMTNSQTGTTYTTVLADSGQVVEAAAAGASTFTIPPNSSVAYPIGSVINFYAAGSGGLTLSPGAGVTIRNNGSPLTQYQEVSLRKRGTDEWVRIG